MVANQIAAGEVVSRPASVVKELLENSIDAGADNITLIVKDAGRTLVQVTDNGCGMDAEDCEKCFLPHATSKITSSEDLQHLSTMGFRGEALSSVASVSQVELRSRRLDDELGTLLVIEGGEVKKKEADLCKKGTDIKVKNIFFNTPARRNFLKSDNIENSHITDTFLRIALVYFDVAFTYYNNDKLVYKLDKSNFKKRITDIYGNSFRSKLLEVKEEVDVVKIEGYVSSLDLSRKNKNEEYFFVNKRFMKNNYFANAVERVYAGLLPEKSFPVFFISLTLDSKNIDVNIHPTKTEVKFLDDKIIYSVLHAAVRKTLGQNTLSTQLDFEKKDIVFPSFNSKTKYYQPHISYDPGYNPFADGLHNEHFNDVVYSKTSDSQLAFENSGFDNEIKVPENFFAPFQFLNKYLVTNMQNSILFIDQHRASQNIIYHRLIKNEDAQTESQQLIIPYAYVTDAVKHNKIKNRLEDLKKLGFELLEKDDEIFELNSVPFSLSIENSISIIENFVLNEQEEISGEENQRESRLFAIADRLSIAYGKVLSKTEIIKLIAELFKLPSADVLPNGERVILRADEVFLDSVF